MILVSSCLFFNKKKEKKRKTFGKTQTYPHAFPQQTHSKQSVVSSANPKVEHANPLTLSENVIDRWGELPNHVYC